WWRSHSRRCSTFRPPREPDVSAQTYGIGAETSGSRGQVGSEQCLQLDPATGVVERDDLAETDVVERRGDRVGIDTLDLRPREPVELQLQRVGVDRAARLPVDHLVSI